MTGVCANRSSPRIAERTPAAASAVHSISRKMISCAGPREAALRKRERLASAGGGLDRQSARGEVLFELRVPGSGSLDDQHGRPASRPPFRCCTRPPAQRAAAA